MRWIRGIGRIVGLGVLVAGTGLQAQDRGDDIHMRPSATGNRIAFYSVHFGPYRSSVWSMAADGSDLRQHMGVSSEEPNSNPQLLGDGRILATRRTADGWDIVLTEEDGTLIRFLTETPGVNEFHPTASPDLSRVIYRLDGEDGGTVFWTVSIEGGEPEVLVELPGSAWHPKWSSDGRFVLFDMDLEIYALDTETLSHRRIAGREGWGFSVPCLSPDGSRVVFNGSLREGMEYGVGDLFVVPFEGGEPTKVTPDGQRALTPCWSPDGSRIIYSNSASSPYSIWSMNPDGSDARPLGVRE